MRHSKWLLASAAIGGVVAFLFIDVMHSHRESLWFAVTPAYAASAMQTSLPLSSSRVPFCFELHPDGRAETSGSCKNFLEKQSRFKVCGFQNLFNGAWQPELINADPLEISRNIETVTHQFQCDVVVLDIENLRAEDRSAFSSWINVVSRTLKRARLRVSIAVHAKTDEAGSWSGAASQDWNSLCASGDELLVMAYDYHYPGATEAGEQAPLEWVGKVLEYASSVCKPSRLRLGLAAYGYSWPSQNIVTEREWLKMPETVRGEAGRAPYFVETASMREEKMNLARKVGVRGFFVWALGMTPE